MTLPRHTYLLWTTLMTSVAAGHGAATAPAPAPQDWMTVAQQNVAAAEYEISWQTSTSIAGLDAAWQAPNRAHNFRIYFTETGIRVVPRLDAGLDWQWGLSLARVGRPNQLESVSSAKLRVERNRIEYAHGEVTAWYVNDQRGLEQGFTLISAPSRERGSVVLDLALDSTLHPTFSSDGQAIDLRAADGSNLLRYAGLKVTDARGHALPARLEGIAEPGLSGIRLAFDDRDAVYPVTVDPLLTAWSWSASGHQASAFFGYAVATAGDVNGDGFSDVIVGAYLFDNGQTDEGRVFVYLGSPSGLAATAAWTSEGNQPNANYGLSVASAGDVNGDGYDDVIIGAIGYPVSASRTGMAFVFHGSASGLSASAAWSANSDGSGTTFGYSVASAGDVNGDDYADVIVSDISGAGRVYVYLGSASGLSPTAAWTKNGTQTAFGHSVATAGDVNGDGYADVIIGAASESNDQTNEGRAYVYLGSASGLASTPVWTGEGNGTAAAFGISVATAGDVNGDGYSDVIVGAYTYGGSDSGRAVVYHGSASGVTTAPQWSVNGSSNERLGTSVATAGDVNGDGYAEVIVGVSRSDGGSGTVMLYHGSAAGLPTTSSFSSNTPNRPADRFGSSVATAGDVNGDGFSDVIVGAYGADDEQSDSGAAYLYLGSAYALGDLSNWAAEGEKSNAHFGRCVASAGDVNGDGFSDVIIGASGFDNGNPNEGRAYLYFGSRTGLASTPSWMADGGQSDAFFGISVASAGDVNGDGFSDVIVGASGYSNGQSGEGRALVYLGSATGLATVASWEVERGVEQARFGRAVGTAGDVNGDGYSDVIVGAYKEGRAFVYLGSAAGLATVASWMAEGALGDEFGVSVATAGDVNGDGYSDVIVGADRYPGDGSGSRGRASLYLGAATGLNRTPAWTADGNQSSSFLGYSVATAGDVNGDGFSDVIVGAYGERRASAYLGSAAGLAAVAAWTVGIAAPSQFGVSVATAGDVNGDGFSDVIVGDSLNSAIRAYLFQGSASGLSSTSSWSKGDPSPQFDSHFAESVASAGDINGDGIPDVIIGAYGFDNGQADEGRALLYYGGAGDGLERIPRQTRTDGTTPLALLTKSDSETEFRVRLRGLTAAGRGRIRLQWEIKPLGTPFNRTNMGLSPAVMTSSSSASGSFSSFNEAITGLNEGKFYHWRMRTISADPFFPSSPWISLPDNAVTLTKLRTAGCIDPDGDGYGALGDPSCVSLAPDCNNSDGAAWSTPGETVGLEFASKTVLSWSPPASPGALISTLRYDTLRSSAPGSFQSATCVESDDGPNTTATDSSKPSNGQAFYYLTRAENSCPQRSGSLGASSAGVPRTGSACP